MKKIFAVSKVFIVILGVSLAATDAQAVLSGVCSIGPCAKAGKGSQKARDLSFNKYKKTMDHLNQTNPPDGDEIAEKAAKEHKAVIGEWVTKNKSLHPNTPGHRILTDSEFDKDQAKLMDNGEAEPNEPASPTLRVRDHFEDEPASPTLRDRSHSE